MSVLSLLDVAEKFVVNLPDKHLYDKDQMLKATSNFLVAENKCSESSALQIAAQAIAKIDSLGVDAFIDVKSTTRQCLIISIDGALRAISLKTLTCWLENQSDEP